MADDHATFRTKTGQCRVERDRLNLERTGIRGGAANALYGDSKARTLLVYGGIVLGLGYYGWAELQRGNTVMAVVFAALAGWIVLSLARTRDFSMVNEVLRSQTDRVEFVHGLPGLTRDRVVVHFRDEGGKPVRRFILMPGVLQQGRAEFDRARHVLAQHGWPLHGA